MSLAFEDISSNSCFLILDWEERVTEQWLASSWGGNEVPSMRKGEAGPPQMLLGAVSFSRAHTPARARAFKGNNLDVILDWRAWPGIFLLSDESDKCQLSLSLTQLL